MTLSVSARQCEPEVTVIDLSGRITRGDENGQIEAAILKALSEGCTRFVMNFAEVKYVDSTGLGMFVYCLSKVSQANARTTVASAPGLILEVFQLTGLHSVIQFYPDVRSACASFLAPSP